LTSYDLVYKKQSKKQIFNISAQINSESVKQKRSQRCPNLFDVLPSGFIFQQNGANAHTAKLAQDFIATNCGEFIDKAEWPPKSPVDYHVLGAMLERYKTLIQSQRTSKT